MIDHESLHEYRDPRLGLSFLIARHTSGDAGIAIGGCRRKVYASLAQARTDALRLSENMTRKYAAMRMDFGGLKGVIPKMDPARRKESFRRIGEWLNEHDGTAYLATDMGTTINDMATIREVSPYVLDLPPVLGGIVPFTEMLVRGVLWGLQAGFESLDGNGALHERSYAIQGLGSAGMGLAKRLREMGATVYGADTDATRHEAAARLGVTVIDPERILCQQSDALIPAAGGDVFTAESIEAVNARLIGGPANNQLAEEGSATALRQRGVLYLPDFIIGAGAILLDDCLIAGQPCSLEEGLGRTIRIYERLREVLARGDEPYRSALRIIEVGA